MSELKPCPLCNADKPYRTATPVIGIPSGDSGYSMTIKCRECGCEIKRWALKKAWAISSAETAWNRRAQPDNEPLTPEELRGMDSPAWCACDTFDGKGGFWCLCQEGVIIPPSCMQFEAGDRHNWVFYRRKPEAEGGEG